MRAVYPGSFDPVTNGHLDILERASQLFEHVTVAVVNNVNKHPLFSTDERVAMLRECTRGMPTITVGSFDGLLIDYVRSQQAGAIIRGLRAISDFEYEFQINAVNKKLAPDIETVFLMTANEYAYLSSSIVKEVASFRGCIDGLVPEFVKAKIQSKLVG
jgi:pantetheine-phosphate adenylyltransferase